MVNTPAGGQTPLHDDLVEMLELTRAVERDLFGAVPASGREVAGRIGAWSTKDVWAHLAAWRSVEARRLAGLPDGTNEGEPDDEANARIQAERAQWTWDAVAAEAAASIDTLVEAIRATTAEELQKSDRLVAGIGANGANHAIAHLADVAALADARERYAEYATSVEGILLRGRLPERDGAVMLYNLACHYALSEQPDDARRLLRDALAMRPDLLDWALQDPDVAAFRDELPGMAGA